jgi:hypothetical protein
MVSADTTPLALSLEFVVHEAIEHADFSRGQRESWERTWG